MAMTVVSLSCLFPIILYYTTLQYTQGVSVVVNAVGSANIMNLMLTQDDIKSNGIINPEPLFVSVTTLSMQEL
jgi:hypothetical protein